MTRGTLHLLIGPVGAGKSTYAKHWMENEPALFLDVDTWMVRLFGDDERPAENPVAWYLERRSRVRALHWHLAENALSAGLDVLLESGLVGRDERIAAYQRLSDTSIQVHLIDAPRDVRRERVMARNEQGGSTQVVPLPFFELASDAWEPPDADERLDWSILDR